MTVWAPIPGFEGRYEVSDQGEVRSLRFVNRHCDKLRDTPKLLKETVTEKGYIRVSLADGSKQKPKMFFVQRLVLLAFKGAPEDGQEAAHLNGVRDDNRLSNLDWVTSTENSSHRIGHGTAFYGADLHNAVFSEEDVVAFRGSEKTREEIAQEVGCHIRTADRMLRRMTYARADLKEHSNEA